MFWRDIVRAKDNPATLPCEIRRAVGKIACLARNWLSQGCKDESSGLRGSLSAIGKAASHVRLFLGTRACAEQMRSLFSNKRGAKKTAVCNTGANRSTFEEITDAVPRGLQVVMFLRLRSVFPCIYSRHIRSEAWIKGRNVTRARCKHCQQR